MRPSRLYLRISNLKVGSHARIRGASADAREAFLHGVRLWRHVCNTSVQGVTRQFTSSESSRRMGIETLRRQFQRSLEVVRPLCERDMAMEAEQ